MSCANTDGIFRTIQSIPSPKAAPFNRWQAKVGYERMQEIEYWETEMTKNPQFAPTEYADLLSKIKQRIRQGQARAVLAANAELIRLYWDIGRILHERQQQEG